ncbi:hypothetical protein RCH23_002140 [Cryobacterium sp. CAN_C3]|uniref:hypothetical protein n=1 Tax=unclassified Cryobacterium TaxID=2649013 RepID=UPI0018CA5B40|nr:hypothetical protein [Cryobacterium sp. CAN_C3]MEC5154755.1 hypothetical protein [Cryobacterium sp. CAN_C3]
MSKPELHETMDRPGRWLIMTENKTQHEFQTYESMYWRRTPAPGSVDAAYDGRFVRLRQLGLVKLGATFELVVSDGSYLYGATTHRSSTVTRIERLGGHCRRCGYPMLLGICWREIVEPGWYDRDREPGRRHAVRLEIERRLGWLRGRWMSAARRLRRVWARVRRGQN